MSWNDYVRETRHVEGHVDFKWTSFDAKGKETLLSDASYHVFVDNDNARVENFSKSSQSEYGKKGFGNTYSQIRNPDYSSALTMASGKSWTMDSIMMGTERKEDRIEGSIRRILLGNLCPLNWYLPELLSHEGVTFDKTWDETIGGQPVVWLSFHLSKELTQKSYLKSGEIAMLPQSSFAILKGRFRARYQASCESLVTENQYDFSESLKYPLPTTCVLKSVSERCQDGRPEDLTDIGGRGIREFKMHLTRVKSIPPEQFRLAQYGLPEPILDKTRRTRWWLIMLLTGSVLLACWRYLVRRESRSGE